MEKILDLRVLLALLMAVAPQFAKADTFFSDNFSNGSTLNSATPVSPTTNSTSYEAVSGKAWNPDISVSSQDMKFGIVHSGGGTANLEALFATNAVELGKVGDYIQLTITFTNTAGLMSLGRCYMGFGLYNSGQVLPVAGGLNATATSASTSNSIGGAQLWQGYIGQIAYSTYKNEITTRASQTVTPLADNDQDLVNNGSSTYAFSFPAATVVGSSATSTLTLADGGTYTEVLTITLHGTNSIGIPNSLAVTNSFYSGPNTSGTLLTQFGAVATNDTFLVSSFDGLAMGWYQKTDGESNVVDISSITVSGQVTPVTNPPVIITQPVSVTAPTNTLVPFTVVASGNDLSYQWHRYGTNLVDGGNISGANSSTLVISPTTAGDVASGANGYYCTIANDLGTTNSTMASLALGTATALVWSGNSPNWDLKTTADWLNPSLSLVTFNYGDNVTFNDTGAGNTAVTLSGQYLSAGSVTVSGGTGYDFVGSGSFAGPGSLIYNGSSYLELDRANTYSGGTIISNATAWLILSNYAGLGSGPVTLAKAGGKMEILGSGNATTGIQGDLVVADDFLINYDGSGSYGAVFLGNLSGTASKTLTVNYNGSGSTASRIRLYGDNTVYNGNLALPNSLTVWANYGASQAFNGVISGSGTLMEKGTASYLNNANTYTGGTIPADGAIGLGVNSSGSPTVTSGPIGTGPLLLDVDSTTSTTGSGQVFASGGARTVANLIQYRTGTNNLTLVIGGTNNLTLSGAFTLNGNDNVTTNTITSRTVQVTNTGLTTISGVISDNSLGYGFNKTGNGILALSTAETYTGPTIVGGGMLLVNGSLGTASVTVTNGLLGGTGTIACAVTATGGGVAPGNNGIGTLTINNTLTLQSGSSNVFEVNKTASTHDQVTVTAVNYGGTLYATNLSGALTTSDSFTIFSAGSHTGNFSTITGSPGAGMAWSFNPTNGVLSVVSGGVATNPTNIIWTVVANGGGGKDLQLSWPLDHLGWTLQTNSVGLRATDQWFAYPGSTSVTNESLTIDPTKTNVFYRLTYTP